MATSLAAQSLRRGTGQTTARRNVLAATSNATVNNGCLESD